MTYRQYVLTAVTALFLAQFLLPRWSVEELMLRYGGELVIRSAAGVETKPGFFFIGKGIAVGDVHHPVVGPSAYVLDLNGAKFQVQVDCNSVAKTLSDAPDSARSKVLESAHWICEHRE